MPGDWIERELGDVLTLNYGWSLPEKKRVPGDVPVYGSNGIVGTHQCALVTTRGLIVGRKGSAGNVHYSRVPFCPIDTTFYVGPDDASVDLEFLYYLLLHVDLTRILGDVGVPGLNREMAYKERARLPSDPDEQRKIAAVLSLVQRAIEQQERLIALTTELKKSLMHKLFTEGLRGEPQKQTEIGPMPRSWQVGELGMLVEDTPKVDMDTEAERAIEYIDVSSVSKESLSIVSTTHYVQKDAPGRARKKVGTGDVLLATVRPTLRRIARVPDELDGQVCSTAFCVLRDSSAKTHGRYIYQVVQREQFIRQLAAIESGVSYPAVTDKQVKEQRVPVPDEAEQAEIAERLGACDAKVAMHRQKHAALSDLFRTLLHQLMTGQARVNEIALPEDSVRPQAHREAPCASGSA